MQLDLPLMWKQADVQIISDYSIHQASSTRTPSNSAQYQKLQKVTPHQHNQDLNKS